MVINMNFLEQNTLYIVLIISLMIWLGIFFYLMFVDKKITRLEKMILIDSSKTDKINSGVINE